MPRTNENGGDRDGSLLTEALRSVLGIWWSHKPTLKSDRDVRNVMFWEKAGRDILIKHDLVVHVVEELLLLGEKVLEKLDVGPLAGTMIGTEFPQLSLEAVDEHLHAVLCELEVELGKIGDRTDGV
jgi:hypothetical protein